MNDAIKKNTKKPNFNKIYGDFHLHTHYSFDTRTSLEQVIERAEKTGINCVAVTDHDTIEGALELRRIAPFKVIIGEEISSSGGHILGLFLTKAIPPHLSVHETITRIHEQGGIAVAAHPFARIAGESLGQEFLDNIEHFDLVEVANSNNLFRSDDRKALFYAEKYGLGKISGSDSHLPCGIGSNVVEMDDFEGPKEFMKSLITARLYNSLHPPQYFLDMALWTVQDVTSDLLGFKSPMRGIREAVT